MNKTINYRVISNYGVPTMYVCPNSEKQREAIRLISGKKTITKEMKEGLEMLGFVFKQVI